MPRCRPAAPTSPATRRPAAHRSTTTRPGRPSGSPDRSPDANGWYARPVSVSIGGSDATSGLAGCSGGGTYSGPDGRGSVGGSCTTTREHRQRRGRDPVRQHRTRGDRCAGRPCGGRERLVQPRGRVPVRRQRRGLWRRVVHAASYGGPDAPTAAVSGTCTDRPGTRARRSSTASSTTRRRRRSRTSSSRPGTSSRS